MEDVQTPEEAIAADEVDELADAPDEATLVGKVKFTDILIT